MGSAATAEGEKEMDDRGIVLVAFGTSVPEARKAYDLVDEAVRKAYPGMEIRWAYTSRRIRAKLAAQREAVDSPETALARLMAQGYRRVGVLSLHVIPGIEFHNLYENSTAFGRMAEGFEEVVVARPLLSSHEDLTRVVEALLKRVPATRKAEEPVVFMGHGSGRHPSHAIYTAVNHLFQERDPLVFLATVDGYPSLQDILPKLAGTQSRKVFLMPFMAVAGIHVINDMVGDDPESWASILRGTGFECEAILTGMAEYAEITAIWLDHLRAVFPPR